MIDIRLVVYGDEGFFKCISSAVIYKTCYKFYSFNKKKQSMLGKNYKKKPITTESS